MRHTGIQTIGDAPWGTHFCQFYDDKQDLIDILIPYFKAGLENNEFCTWITADLLSVEEATAALASEIGDLGEYVRKGQLEILDYNQWYTPGGKFESDRVPQCWIEKVQQARSRGFDGLRLTGDTSWLDKSDWEEFTEYEATMEGVIGRYPMLAICTYNLANCGALKVMDVLKNHGFALIKRGDDWQVIERTAHAHEAAKLSHLNRTLKAHSRSNQALMLATDEAAYLHEVCRIIDEDCGHAMVWVGFKEQDEAKTIRPVAYFGFEEGYLETLSLTWADTEYGRGPMGTAIRTGRVCTCSDMLTDPSFLPWREQAIRRGYASSIALPIMDGDKVFGALAIYAREPDAFSDDEVKLLTKLTSDLAYGINVLRLRAAHALAEQTLQESEERYRSLVDMSPDAVLVNCNNRIVQLNPAAIRLFGADRADQILGKSLFELFHPDYHALIRERMECVLAGETGSLVEEKLVRLDGTTCDVEVAASRCGALQGPAVQAILRDITGRKQAEESIKHLASFPEMNPNPVIEIDLRGDFVYTNPAAPEMLRTLGVDWDPHVFLPSDISSIISAREGTFQREVRIGDRTFAEDIYAWKHLGIIRIYARDITERKQTEEALRQQREWLRVTLSQYWRRSAGHRHRRQDQLPQSCGG